MQRKHDKDSILSSSELSTNWEYLPFQHKLSSKEWIPWVYQISFLEAFEIALALIQNPCYVAMVVVRVCVCVKKREKDRHLKYVSFTDNRHKEMGTWVSVDLLILPHLL